MAILEEQVKELYSLVDDGELMNKAFKVTLSPTVNPA